MVRDWSISWCQKLLVTKVFEWQTPDKTCNMITWLAIVVVVDVLLLLFYFWNVVTVVEGNKFTVVFLDFVDVGVVIIIVAVSVVVVVAVIVVVVNNLLLVLCFFIKICHVVVATVVAAVDDNVGFGLSWLIN